MTVDYRSMNALLRSGDDHFQCLNGEVDAWAKSEPYTVIHERNSDSTEYAVGIKFHDWPDLFRWATVARSAINDYRSALDNFIYALAVHYTDTSPPPLAHKLAFPICDDEQLFERAVTRTQRLGTLVDIDGFRAAVENTQPYDSPDRADYLPLRRLRDLDDRKKHRELILTAFTPQSSDIRFNIQGDNPAVITHWTGGLEQTTPLLTLKFARPHPPMEVDLQVSILIAFEDGPEGGPAMLQVLADVRQVVLRCRREITTALGLPYE